MRDETVWLLRQAAEELKIAADNYPQNKTAASCCIEAAISYCKSAQKEIGQTFDQKQNHGKATQD